MTTIFDILSALLYKKNKIQLDVEGEKAFSLYMTNRWISMYAPDKAVLINSTINKWWGVFDTKQQQFDFLLSLLSKCKFKKINYLKKSKKEKTAKSDEEDIDKVAAATNLMSVREYKELKKMLAG